MAISRAEETDILLRLQSCPLDPAGWDGFLSALRGRTNADLAALILRQPGAAPACHLAGRTPPTAAQRRMFEVLCTTDPLNLQRLRFDRVYALDELLVPGDAAHRALSDEVLAPAGARFLRLMRVADGEGATGLLAVLRRAEDLGGAVSARLSALAPHLGVSIRLFRAVERDRSRLRQAEDLAARLSCGWLTLGQGGVLADLDQTAAALLRPLPGARATPGERLALPDGAPMREITRALEDFAADPNHPPRAFALWPRPRLQLLLHPVTDQAHDGPVAVGLLRGPAERRGLDPAPLGDLFGLTPAEARLALHLGAGHGIAATATTLGLTEETARTYSKRIYAKLGVHGQPGLVRLIQSSVAMLA